MFETLLLANPDSKTLRPVRSRASTRVPRTRTASHVFEAPFLGRLVVQFARQRRVASFANHSLVRIYRFNFW